MSDSTTDTPTSPDAPQGAKIPKRTKVLAGILGVVILAGIGKLAVRMMRAEEPVAVVATPPVVAQPAVVPVEKPLAAVSSDEWKKRPSVLGVLAIPTSIEPTAEQKAQYDKLCEELGPPLLAAMEAVEKSYSREQAQAREDASAMVKEKDLKGQEAVDLILEAMNLTEEQKKLRADMIALRDETRQKILNLFRPAK